MGIQTVMSLLGFSVLPCAVLLGGYFVMLRAQARRPERFANPMGHSLADSALLTLVFIAWATVTIATSTPAKAPFGFALLPLCALAVALLSFAAVWALRTLIEAARGRARGSASTIGAASVLIVILTGGPYAWYRYTWLSEAASDQTPPARLAAIAEDALAANDFTTLERLAANPALAVAIAEKMTALCQGEIDSQQRGRCTA